MTRKKTNRESAMAHYYQCSVCRTTCGPYDAHNESPRCPEGHAAEKLTLVPLDTPIDPLGKSYVPMQVSFMPLTR